MLVTYPAIFYYDPNENVKYFVHFPDFKNSATQGDDITDAMAMAAEWLGIMVSDSLESGTDLPAASFINDLTLDGNNPFKDDADFELSYDPKKSFISMVTVDLTNYLDASKPIKKTLTIPNWADKLGRKMKINFSETLTNAIAEQSAKQKV